MNNQLKLIEIRRRNLEILQKQKAHFDPGFVPLHIVNSISENEQAIAEIEKELKRRLQALLIQAAQYGISTEPSITIEIEDIQEYFEKNRPKSDYI